MFYGHRTGVRKISREQAVLSLYAAGLQTPVRERYLDKISVLNYVDPLIAPVKFTSDNNSFPPTTTIDIFDYFVLRKSAYTGDDLKAYTSLDSYRYFISGWIRKIETALMNNHIVIRGKVSISLKFLSSTERTWDRIIQLVDFYANR